MRPDLALLAILAFAVRIIPIMIGGGLHGLHGYDDGVYFGAAIALVSGVVPYRDFLLLHPPGIVVLLLPFAALGTSIGDPAAFAAARTSFMALGALNAVVVALVAGRYGRLSGLSAGALYAVWNTAANGERSTDLHAPENTFLLLGLLAVSRSGRIGSWRAALAGAAVGLATAVQLWQAASLAVVTWWIIVRGRGSGLPRLRPALVCLAVAGLAFGLVCLPFFTSAPDTMVRYVIVDQVNRPSTGIDLIERVRVLEGLPQASQLPPSARMLVIEPIALGAAAAGLTLAVVTAWRRPWTRPWAVLAMVQTAVVLSTPSFFNDYASLVAPAATLVIGTGLAESAAILARRGWRPRLTQGTIAVLLSLTAVGSVARHDGAPLPLSDIGRDISTARCVSADSPALLVLTSSLRRSIAGGCRIVLDPSGTSYDTDRGRLVPGRATVSRRQAPGYQSAMLEWYTSGDAALFARLASDGLTRATEAAIERDLPIQRRRGVVTVRLATP
jgi:hypothetical protein